MRQLLFHGRLQAVVFGPGVRLVREQSAGREAQVGHAKTRVARGVQSYPIHRMRRACQDCRIIFGFRVVALGVQVVRMAPDVAQVEQPTVQEFILHG